MSIDTLRVRGRSKIALFQAETPVEGLAAFSEREFIVEQCTRAQLEEPGYLAGLSAVIFEQRIDNPRQIVRDLKSFAKRLLDYDCRVILLPAPNRISLITRGLNDLRLQTAGLPLPEAEHISAWQPIGRGDPPLPHLHVFDVGFAWVDIANFIAEHPAGHAPSVTLNVNIDGETESSLGASSRLLIRRAFWDCTEVHLVPMLGGRSGVSVYRAYAELAKGHLERWPLPFFVKLGDRDKIFTEYQNYENKVDPYIPFHLGPHLVQDRCVLGAHEGLIVGDYVDESESLIRCARDGRAVSAIACLFDRTLHSWYRSARIEARSLTDILSHRFPREISTGRFARARELGAKKDLAQLRELFERCTSTPVLVGPVHGDLHAANVRVRATDAILIDFYAHRDDLLLYDAASLEASLLVDAFADGDRDELDVWLKSIAPLYDEVPLHAPLNANPKNPSLWFHLCVRQIRLYARRMECVPNQYGVALAAALLAKASKDPSAPNPQASRRAAAYVMAERVLSNTYELLVKRSS